MNEASVRVLKTSSVRNVSLCVCMTSLLHTEHDNSWPTASASAGTGDVVFKWKFAMTNKYASISSERPSEPNTKLKKKKHN